MSVSSITSSAWALDSVVERSNLDTHECDVHSNIASTR